MPANIVADLAIVLGVAAATGALSHQLRQPPVLGYLFAGLVVGPYLPVPLFADVDRMEELSELGKAASDFVLMPSLYEPCGLPQMEGPRFGALPVVRRTGGRRASDPSSHRNGPRRRDSFRTLCRSPSGTLLPQAVVKRRRCSD